MPTRPPTYNYGRPTRQARRDRPSASRRGYGRRWRVASREFLDEHPLCKTCGADGRTAAAEVVDHIQPHRGDAGLFWDSGNWQPLCKRCHDRKTAAERAGAKP